MSLRRFAIDPLVFSISIALALLACDRQTDDSALAIAYVNYLRHFCSGVPPNFGALDQKHR